MGEERKANTIRKSDIDTDERGQHLVSFDVILAVSNNILPYCLRFILLMAITKEGWKGDGGGELLNSKFFAFLPAKRNNLSACNSPSKENSEDFNAKNLCAPRGERQPRRRISSGRAFQRNSILISFCYCFASCSFYFAANHLLIITHKT